MISPAAELLPTAISDLFADVTSTGKVSLADRYGIRTALLNGDRTEDELRAIDRILRAAHRGRVAISSDLSTLWPNGH